MRSAVLFIVFNRPDTTKQVFEAIRKAQPPRLYVAADGPRHSKVGELGKCEEVRRIATAVDWDCEVKVLFREKNLGCKVGVSSGIDWFFEQEEEGIILEDDCLPCQAFFDYCDVLLSRYKNDTRIWNIDGSNYLKIQDSDSYTFSKYALIWGWATWRRAWKEYDVNMRDYEALYQKNYMSNIWDRKVVQKYWENCLAMTFYNKIDTWDYQWMHTIWKNNGLSIRPGKNLIKNIGFRADATHTIITDRFFEAQQVFEDYKLCEHPKSFYAHKGMDDELSVHRFRVRPLVQKVINRLKNLF